MKYDPSVEPDTSEWMKADEVERIHSVEDFHREARIKIPNEQAHAIIHAIVETQIAIGVPAVLAAMQRLRSEGLDRHESVHAVGTLLAQFLHKIVSEKAEAVPEVTNEMYANALKSLTVSWWRKNFCPKGGGKRRL
jgi:hypothetical protein